jgi:PleD family two-component response regulator
VLDLNLRDEIDVAAHFGGEELAVPLPTTSTEGRAPVRERLQM